MKRMLINATQPEELRVALVDGQRLYDLDIESGAREQKKANIYRGKITRVEPSLEAAFVDFGAERHGFLPLKEISREYFVKDPSGRPNIKEVIKEGQEVIVQVDKEERGNKGAALTTFISLAGRFLVLMPNNPRAGGISRRIEGDERAQLKDAMGALTLPDKMGVIVRTAGIGRSTEELQWDLDYLAQVWEAITEEAGKRSAPFLIYRESNVIIRAMRDYLRQDIGEVLIDSPEVHQEALGFIRQVMPSYQQKIKLYADDVPLFSRFQIESQIETAYQREVKLPSGGSVVIDHTEALVSIDINSARATRGSDIEETALQTNVEAADEIARQLRLRDIGGLVVIDFIDMSPARNQREVENRVRDALKLDRARVQIGRISRFGLMEMSRQRLRPSLGETSGVVCPRCDGQGTIRDVRSMSLSIMRLIEEEAMKERSAQIRAILPIPVATYLLNEKRATIADIEARQGVKVILLPSAEMDTPHYDVQRLRDDHVSDEGEDKSSFELSTDTEVGKEPDLTLAKPIQRSEAAVKSVVHTAPAPASLQQGADDAQPADETPVVAPNGLLSRFFKGLGKLIGPADEAPSSSARQDSPSRTPASDKPAADTESRNNGGNRNRRRDSRDSQQGDKRRDDARRDDNQRDDARRDDTKRDDARRDGARRNDNRRDDNGQRDKSRDDKRNGKSPRQENGSDERKPGRQKSADTEKTDKPATKGDKGDKSDKPESRSRRDAGKPEKKEQKEQKPAESVEQTTAADGKPKRTRNNPRQRSRKHALNPKAVTEQERLQAEAAAEPASPAASSAEASATPATDASRPTETARDATPAKAAQAPDTDAAEPASADESAKDEAATAAAGEPTAKAQEPATSGDKPRAKKSARPRRPATETASKPAAAQAPEDDATATGKTESAPAENDTASREANPATPTPASSESSASHPQSAGDTEAATSDATPQRDAPAAQAEDTDAHAPSAGSDDAASTAPAADEATSTPATPAPGDETVAATGDADQAATQGDETGSDDTRSKDHQSAPAASDTAPVNDAVTEPSTPTTDGQGEEPAETTAASPSDTAQPAAASAAAASVSEETTAASPAEETAAEETTAEETPEAGEKGSRRRRRRAHNDPREQRRQQSQTEEGR
ncbi:MULTISPECIES: ribonuclease E [unclassified Modicisalibacter]|uniref:ribonuclease E n=1 Tax=unclassified Modicisalibacter TaxID=2679913 RepID=UPI001CCD66A9|nr:MULTISPECIES: ribonuclease E [unclassified Modicisalibacter]MBZ9556550.1 ribonuclease E [Modicisalibacter sp. R2A 31.J]MBZ9574981.1 ribonuclease E [Modicisalibacter sp. MOD 31.J]